MAVGGAEMMATNIANALAESNTVSYLCATRSEGPLKSKLDECVGYIFLNKRYALDLKAIFKLKKFISDHNIGVIHAHSSSFFMATIQKLINPKLKLIWHDHFGNSEQLSQRKMQPLKFCSNYFNAIISVNQVLKSWSEQHLHNANIQYVPNFAELNDTETKTKLNGKEGKRIICLAAFRPQKDHINLLNAFRSVIEKFPDWTLHLVGNHLNDAYFNAINNYIDVHELSKHIFLYHGALDVKHILSQSTIGILSSKSEGLPVALLEYGLAKLPVIVTDVGNCSSVIENGKLGILVASQDSNQLSQAMIQLINSNQTRTNFGELLYEHINKNFTKKNVIHKFIEIYNS